MPLIPVAPRARQCARIFSIGSWKDGGIAVSFEEQPTHSRDDTRWRQSVGPGGLAGWRDDAVSRTSRLPGLLASSGRVLFECVPG